MSTQNTPQESFRQSEIREQNYDARMASIAGPGLQPKRSGSGIQLSGAAMDRWSNDIDTSIANGSEALTRLENGRRLIETMPLADAGSAASKFYGNVPMRDWSDTANPDIRRDIDPVPGSNHDAVVRQVYDKFQRDVRALGSLNAQEAAEQAAREQRMGLGGAGRGLREGVVNVTLSPYHLYTSVRDNGVLGAGGRMLEGMANMPSMLYDAAQNGDMQTLVSTGVETVLGAKLPRLPGAVRSLAQDLREFGVADWDIRLASPKPGVLYSNPIPLEFERIGSLSSDRLGWAGTGGAGPVAGTIGITDSTSVAALKNYYPRGGGVEFVFDSTTNTFVAGRPVRGLFDGSPHEQLAQSIGAADRSTTVGGTFQRGSGGEFFTTENSGHYGRNWNNDIRANFEKWLNERVGLPVVHQTWGR